MSMITGLTRGGVEWTPSFITALDPCKCIGCGRCFKVCPRSVFELVERGDDMVLDDDDDDYGDGYDDYDDGFSDDTSMVMSLANPLDCIGCESCLRVCPNRCMSHAPQPLG